MEPHRTTLLRVSRNFRFACIGFALCGCALDAQDGDVAGVDSTEENFDWSIPLNPDPVQLDPGITDTLREPHILRIHTCDQADAITADPAVASFQFEGFGGGPVEARVALPKAGEKRNSWNEYSVLMNLYGGFSGLKSMDIAKRGRNAWCIDAIELVWKGTKVWSFDAKQHRADRLIVPRPQGPVWIDDDRSELTPTSSLRFSDLQIPRADATTQAPVLLDVRTCTQERDAGAATNDPVFAEITHDGVTDIITLDNLGNDRELGKTDTYVLDEHGIQNVTGLKLLKRGANSWCFDKIYLRTQNGGGITFNIVQTLNGASDQTVKSSDLVGSMDLGRKPTSEKAYVGLRLHRQLKPAALMAIVDSISGCSPYFKVSVSVSNTGELPGTATVAVDAEARLRYWWFSCSTCPLLEPAQGGEKEWIWGSNGELANVKVDPGERASVDVDLHFDFPGLTESVDMKIEPYLSSGIAVGQHRVKWSRSLPPPTFSNQGLQTVCF